MNKQNITDLIARCSLPLTGYDYNTGAPIDVAKRTKDYLLSLASAETNLAINETDSADVKQAKSNAMQTLRDALDGDRAALRSLNALRLEEVDNFIKAGSNWMRFFNVVTLGPSDEPGVKFVTGTNEARIGYLAQDGSPRSMKVEPNQAHTRIPLRYITSDKYGYYTQDIYKGDISGLAQRTLDIAFDIQFKMDRYAYDLLNAAVGSGGAYGTFTFTGAKASRVYVSHSGVVTTHFPTTNDITVYRRNSDGDFIDANGGVAASGTVIAGKFDPSVLREAISYCNKWGNVFTDGRLTLTGEVVVPAIDVEDMLFKFTPTEPGKTQTDLEKAVTANGYTSVNFGGIMWRLIPDVTIPSGACYPLTNKKPGNIYLKPSLDAEWTDTQKEKHYEERSQQKVWGAYILNQKRMNVLKLTYKS